MVKTLRGLAFVAALATASSLGVAAPASADPTLGTIAGQFTDGGAPMAGIMVFVSRTDGSAFSYQLTDNSGFYRTRELPPGDYKVEFDLRWGRQYAYQKSGWDTATIFTIAAGTEITVNDTLMPTGSLSGRFTERDGVTGIGGVNVSGIGPSGATTDAQGYWSVPKAFVRADYIISFNHWQRGIYQFAYGKNSYETADRVSVTANTNTVVNDSLLPTGTVRVTATNKLTGAAINSFTASIGFKRGHTETGEVIITDVPVGAQSVHVDAEGYFGSGAIAVTVVEGQQAQAAATLQPPAFIEATVVDAATGAPLAGVCVAAVGREERPTEGCWNISDEQGKITVGYLWGGSYKLMAFPTEAPGYGIQWVGANSGKGKQHLAAEVTVAAGQTVAAPVIKMDRAGSLSGRVTRPSGAAPQGGWAAIYPVVSSSGEVPPGHAVFDDNGNYTFDNLGPYDWQLFFWSSADARQFSGGVANRLLAQAVPVTVGATSTYDFRLRAGVEVTVNLTGAVGEYPTLMFFNAVTGDPLEQRQVYPNPTSVTLPVVGPQFVKIAVQTSAGQRWVGGTDMASANAFWIPATGSKTLTINL